MVYDSYLKVCDKNGGAGIDRETIDRFNKDLESNLYKVWNRMASGSYFPPAVRTVLIPKKQGGTRPLGIPKLLSYYLVLQIVFGMFFTELISVK
jgi:RNA-directed DNA polymerase